MSSPPDDVAHVRGPVNPALGCLSTSVPASFHRAWPSEGDVVPSNFGIAWAMAGIDWRIEMDLDGASLDPGPITTGPWQSFAIESDLPSGSAHTLSRRIFEGETLVYADEITFTVGDAPSAPAATPLIVGLAMVEDHPQPCDWEPLVGSPCEADLIRHGCANPIESFPSYAMAADPNTLLHVVTSADGTREVSSSECPALREVIAWNCPESACVTITAVGRDGRLGASTDHCDDEDAWLRSDDAGEGGDDTTDGSTTGEPGATSTPVGCAVSNGSELVISSMSVLLGVALLRGLRRANRPAERSRRGAPSRADHDAIAGAA